MLQASNNHFLLLEVQARLMALLKKSQIFIKIKFGRATLVKERIYKCMNLICLVAFENFKWLLMTPGVIYNDCNFTKEYWSNILSNQLLHGNIWMSLAILSHAKCQWKVCYNKLKQENFQKTHVGGEIYLSRTCSHQWSY